MCALIFLFFSSSSSRSLRFASILLDFSGDASSWLGHFSHFEFRVFIILSSCSFVSFYVCSFELYKFPLCLTSFFFSLSCFSCSFVLRFFFFFCRLQFIVYDKHTHPTHKFLDIVSMSQTTRKCLIIHFFPQHILTQNLSLDHVRFALQTLTQFFEAKKNKRENQKKLTTHSIKSRINHMSVCASDKRIRTENASFHLLKHWKIQCCGLSQCTFIVKFMLPFWRLNHFSWA